MISEALTPQELKTLLESPRVGNKPRTAGKAWVRNPETGQLEKVALVRSDIGGFHGRHKNKRSRKGRTYPAPGNYRRYDGTWQDPMASYKL